MTSVVLASPPSLHLSWSLCPTILIISRLSLSALSRLRRNHAYGMWGAIASFFFVKYRARPAFQGLLEAGAYIATHLCAKAKLCVSVSGGDGCWTHRSTRVEEHHSIKVPVLSLWCTLVLILSWSSGVNWQYTCTTNPQELKYQIGRVDNVMHARIEAPPLGQLGWVGWLRWWCEAASDHLACRPIYEIGLKCMSMLELMLVIVEV